MGRDWEVISASPRRRPPADRSSETHPAHSTLPYTRRPPAPATASHAPRPRQVSPASAAAIACKCQSKRSENQSGKELSSPHAGLEIFLISSFTNSGFIKKWCLFFLCFITQIIWLKTDQQLWFKLSSHRCIRSCFLTSTSQPTLLHLTTCSRFMYIYRYVYYQH